MASVLLAVYEMRGQNSDDSWVNSLKMVSSAVPTAPGNVSMMMASSGWDLLRLISGELPKVEK